MGDHLNIKHNNVVHFYYCIKWSAKSWSVTTKTCQRHNNEKIYTRWYPKFSRLVPPPLQQLWYWELPVDGRTPICRESVCQVARSWVEVCSFYTRLCGVVLYVTCGDFHVGSEKGTRRSHRVPNQGSTVGGG
jgi:hypothetical protein